MKAYVAKAEPGAFSGIINMYGANENKLSSFEQQNTKPAIDDVICHYLDGSTLKDALSFIDYIRNSKMKIKWSAVNVWSVRYKNKRVLDILVSENTWRVRLVFDHMSSNAIFSQRETETMSQVISTLRYKIPENLELSPALS